MDMPGWLSLLGALVVAGAVVYVLIREDRMDKRLAAAEARDKVSQRPGDLLPRLGARLIDMLPFSLIYTVLNFAFDPGFVLAVMYVSVLYAYFVLLDTYAGTTVGKRLLGLRVTGSGGDKPELKQAALREAFIVVSAVLGAIPLVGDWLGQILWIAIAVTISNSRTKQGKHDQIAGGTRVIKVGTPTAATVQR
jgi:uncharacterized RDD family membrane protein YckC